MRARVRGSAAAAPAAATAATATATAAGAGRGRGRRGGTADRHRRQQLHRVVVTGGAGRGCGRLGHRTALLEGVSAGAAAVLVARHAPRLAGTTALSQRRRGGPDPTVLGPGCGTR